MKKPHLVIDVALCQGCNNCFLACKDEHAGNDWPGYTRPQSPHGEHWIDIPCKERGQYPLIDVAYRPTLCTHCADAPCVARSEGAITKRSDGIVLIDPQKAAGRQDLVEACPYGMISWSEESSAPQKCTLCAHLLDNGWTKPRCAQVCGPGALSFVWETDAAFAERAEAEGIATLHPGSPERTSVCYKNLPRFDSCFIAGSVAVERAGIVDCATGRAATLKRAGGSQGVADGGAGAGASGGAGGEGTGDGAGAPGAAGSADGEVVQTVFTDAFGDFKFDGLKPGSGEYVVEIASNGHGPVRMAVKLEASVNLGTIMVGGER
jgi:Fe-S-cluster-containing dehydrogenase component